jgi:hypothetical protein
LGTEIDEDLTEAERREHQRHLWVAGGLGDGPEGVCAVAAYELVGAVDDHLRGVVVFGTETLDVLALALGELVRRKAVVPAQRFPVVHVFFENDDVGSRNGLLMLQVREQRIGGWAVGAAFGGDEIRCAKIIQANAALANATAAKEMRGRDRFRLVINARSASVGN